MQLRRVFTLKQPLVVYNSDVGNGTRSKLMLPKSLCIPLASFNLDVNVEFVENPENIEIEKE